MSSNRRTYDREFREGAVRIVLESGRPIAAVARHLGVNEGTLGNWVAWAREAKHRARPLSERGRRREALTEAIWGSYRASGYTYGSARITADLWEAGWQVSVNIVADIVAEYGWVGRERLRRRSLTR